MGPQEFRLVGLNCTSPTYEDTLVTARPLTNDGYPQSIGMQVGGTVIDIMAQVGLSATGGDTRRPLEEVLASYSAVGYRYFEAWPKGRGSAMEMSDGPEIYRKQRLSVPPVPLVPPVPASSLHQPRLPGYRFPAPGPRLSSLHSP